MQEMIKTSTATQRL